MEVMWNSPRGGLWYGYVGGRRYSLIWRPEERTVHGVAGGRWTLVVPGVTSAPIEVAAHAGRRDVRMAQIAAEDLIEREERAR